MHFISFSDIFSAPIVKALSWTLVHSIWIGILLSLVTGVIMLTARKANAALRYNLLTGAFAGFVITMIVILSVQLSAASIKTDQIPTASALTANASANAGQHFYFATDKTTITSSVNNFLNSYSDIIVVIWFLMIVFRSVTFAGGIKKINRLKKDQLSSPGEEWSGKLTTLCEKLGIKQQISFFQSGIAAIPMVVGHFKPLILFPVGLLNSLSSEEAEAILIHELAHIKRRDFLVNMLQHITEILFFFNPAVLWVSSLIRAERENCCDDIAVSNTGNKRNYINALVSFQEYHLGQMQYAPALADTKNHLLQRVKRMLTNNSGSLSNREKTSLAACLAAVIIAALFFSSTGMAQKNKVTSVFSTLSDTSIADRRYDPAAFAEGSTTLLSEKINGITHVLRIYKRNGVLYEIYRDIKSFKINGTMIPREDWGKYRALMSSLIKEMGVIKKDPETFSAAREKFIADSITAEKDNRTAEDDSKTSAEDSKASAADSRKYDEEQSKIYSGEAVTQKLKADLDAKANELKRKQAELQQKQETVQREIEWRKTEDGKPVAVSKLSYSKNYNTNAYVNPVITYPAIDYKNYNDYKPVSDNKAVSARDEQRKTSAKTSYILTGIQSDGTSNAQDIDIRSLTQNFINDLTAANVINSTANLSYKMSTESLIVNGVVQSDALHQRLMKKYIQSSDWKLLYNWKETR